MKGKLAKRLLFLKYMAISERPHPCDLVCRFPGRFAQRGLAAWMTAWILTTTDWGLGPEFTFRVMYFDSWGVKDTSDGSSKAFSKNGRAAT